MKTLERDYLKLNRFDCFEILNLLMTIKNLKVLASASKMISLLERFFSEYSSNISFQNSPKVIYEIVFFFYCLGKKGMCVPHFDKTKKNNCRYYLISKLNLKKN